MEVGEERRWEMGGEGREGDGRVQQDRVLEQGR